MRSLSIAAASIAYTSPAMLIARQETGASNSVSPKR
jgi:hypothetical protein